MDFSQIFMLLIVFMCGLLTGHHIGKDSTHKTSSNLQSSNELENSCTHDVAIVRPDAVPTDGSLLICENCGADFGNIRSFKS